MSHKYKILFGALAGIAMSFLWGIVFFELLGIPGIFIGIGFGIAFASCGCLVGDLFDKKNNKNR